MRDKIKLFKDEMIMSSPISVVMINGLGKEELGLDNGGVLRDVLPAFGTSFYNSCTVGEEE